MVTDSRELVSRVNRIVGKQLNFPTILRFLPGKPAGGEAVMKNRLFLTPLLFNIQ